jgi:hypothetical protein
MDGMKRLLPVALLLLAGMTAGCTKGSAPAADAAGTPILPLKVGNEWIGVSPSSSGGQQYDTVRIVGDTTIRGEKWYMTQYGARLANRGDGLYMWSRWDSVPFRLIKFPVTVGDTLEDLGEFQQTYNNSSRPDPFRLVLVVTAIDETVVVPAGTFKCIRANVRCRTASGNPCVGVFDSDYVDYAPGTGRIKSRNYLPRLGAGGDPWQLAKASLQ